MVLRYCRSRTECRSALRENRRGRGHEAARAQRSRWVQGSRVQGIGEQVVIPKVLVAAEEQPKVVPFILSDAQASNIVRIAAISEVAETQVVEQESIVIERAHLQGVVEKTKAGTEVLERIVGVCIAVDLARSISGFDGRMDIVIARINSFQFSGVFLGASNRRKQDRQDKDRERYRVNPQAALHTFSAPIRKSRCSLTGLPAPLLEEGRIEVGAVNLRVTQNARLEKAGLVVERRGSRRAAEA